MNQNLPHPVNFQVSSLMGKKVLVIDDDKAMLTAVSKVLRYAGAQPTSAESVAEAVGHLAEEGAKYDLVLTDLRMPAGSGRSILSIVKMAYPDIPVLVMSAFWTPELREECEQLGASKFLDKPLNSMKLLGAVGKAVIH